MKHHALEDRNGKDENSRYQLKEIIYTVIFAALGILLILLLIYMFTDKDDEVAPTSTKLYTAGNITPPSPYRILPLIWRS